MHAHFDCFSGISGDMIIGAFIDLGISAEWLEERIRNLSIGDVEIAVENVKKNTIGAKQVTVIEKTAQPSVNYRDIITMLGKNAMNEKVSSMAADIFSRIAEAEARIHRCEVDEVHFHEVGAIDSIVDIVGASLCLKELNITSVSSSPLPLGGGFVDCRHGRLPVPAPATLEILKGLPVYGGTIEGERVTPTGAAIISSICKEFGPIPDMTVEHIGYGSGSREYKDIPNVLRILVGEKNEVSPGIVKDVVCVLETHIDDMNPEIFGYLMEKLFKDGALDVCYTPIMMKKNRPGTKIEVMCPPEKQSLLTTSLFSETSTIGIRHHLVHRHMLKRGISTVDTRFGSIKIKRMVGLDGQDRCAPEYEMCRKVALEKNVPLKTVYDIVTKAIIEEEGDS